VFVLVRLNVPEPVFVSVPVPLITPTKVVEALFAPVLNAPAPRVTLPPETTAVPLAVVPMPGALKATEGTEVYPLPGFVMLTPVTAPPEIIAVPVAPDPPPPLNVTVGGELYPDPPLETVTLATMPVLASEPMVSLRLLTFRIAPAANETADVEGITLFALTVSVPALMFVAPV